MMVGLRRKKPLNQCRWGPSSLKGCWRPSTRIKPITSLPTSSRGMRTCRSSRCRMKFVRISSSSVVSTVGLPGCVLRDLGDITG